MNQGKLVVRCVKSVLELLELWNVYVMSQAWLLSQCKLRFHQVRWISPSPKEVPAPTIYPMPISPWWGYLSLSGLYLGSESLFPVPKRFTNFPTLDNEPGPWNWYDPLMLGYNRSHHEGSRFFVGHTYPIPAGSFTQVLVLYFNFRMRLVKSKSFGGLV